MALKSRRAPRGSVRWLLVGLVVALAWVPVAQGATLFLGSDDFDGDCASNPLLLEPPREGGVCAGAASIGVSGQTVSDETYRFRLAGDEALNGTVGPEAHVVIHWGETTDEEPHPLLRMSVRLIVEDGTTRIASPNATTDCGAADFHGVCTFDLAIPEHVFENASVGLDVAIEQDAAAFEPFIHVGGKDPSRIELDLRPPPTPAPSPAPATSSPKQAGAPPGALALVVLLFCTRRRRS